MSVAVKIDGTDTSLTFDSYSGSRGYQYLTPGARSSHAFGFRIEEMKAGVRFRCNGHTYEIVGPPGAPS